jgi:hypothetical protein
MVLAVVALVLTMIEFFFTDVKSVGSIVCFCAVLLGMELVAFYAHACGFVAMTLALGGMLYGAAMLIETLQYYRSQ